MRYPVGWIGLWLVGLVHVGRAEEPAPADPGPAYTTRVRATVTHKEPVSTALEADEAGRIPGAQGDALKAVEDLPGVGRSPPGAGQLVLWGAAPGDSRVLVDGVEIPALYHFGGWRSLVGPALVRSIELVPGALGPEYGRGLGGLVRVTSRDPMPRGLHGAVRADFLDAGGTLSWAAGERFQLALAGRYGYFDRLAQAAVPGALALVPIPRSGDAQLRARVRLSDRDTVRVTVLYGSDQLTRTLPVADPTVVRQDRRTRSFYRLGLEHTRQLAGGGRAVVTGYGGLDEETRAEVFGAIPARLDRRGFNYGVRIHYEQRVHPRLSLRAGLDWRGERTRLARSGSLTLPAREGDPFVFGQSPGSDVNSDRWTTHQVDIAPWVQGELVWGALKLVPGVRLDAFLLEVSRRVPRVGATLAIGDTRLRWALDPRLALAWSLRPRLTLHAAAGLYHQLPAPDDRSAVFGNPALGPSRAVQVSAGAALRPWATVDFSIALTGFYRHLDRQVVRAAEATPPLAAALSQDGRGRSYGAQLLVRLHAWRGLSGWLAYTVGRSERREHPEAAWRLADYDQTHLLTVVASWQRHGWGVGVRLRHATGLPRTPVVGAYFDVTGDQFQPLLGGRNTIRLPDFVQLDVRVDRRVSLKALTLDVYLDVQNLTYRKNAEEFVYSRDYLRRDVITGLPLVAVAGLELSH